jgi:hypothetical protein
LDDASRCQHRIGSTQGNREVWQADVEKSNNNYYEITPHESVKTPPIFFFKKPQQEMGIPSLGGCGNRHACRMQSSFLMLSLLSLLPVYPMSSNPPYVGEGTGHVIPPRRNPLTHEIPSHMQSGDTCDFVAQVTYMHT